MPAGTVIKFRRGLAADWATANPVMASGELGYETDTRRYKFGDGATAWSALGYVKPLKQSDYDAILPWTITKTVVSWASGAVRTGSWTLIAESSDLFAFVLSNSPAAQNDEVGWDFPMAAGTWNFSAVVILATSGGIITVNLDGVPVGTIDTYNAATLHNQLVLLTGITVPTNGKHRVSLKMASKNAASTQYELYLSGFQLRRTA